VRIAGTRIAVFRTRAGDVYATQAVCPHRGGPLADGLIGGGVLACPLHEFRFELSTGAPLSDGCESLRTYPVRLDPRGHVVISIAEWGRSEDV
jgi:nitrite reductase (NADH) small subunit